MRVRLSKNTFPSSIVGISDEHKEKGVFDCLVVRKIVHLQKIIMNMKKIQTTESQQASKRENVKNIFKKMIADKRAVQSYIREHGTLNGFKNETIVFAKPL